MKNKYVWHLIAFPLFFTLFYVESIKIGEVKIAILWKILLLFFIFSYFFMTHSFFKLQKFVIFYLSYTLSLFIAPTVNQFAMIETLPAITKNLFIVLPFQIFKTIKKSNTELYQILLTLSIYIIFSAIPFVTGLLHPFTQGYDLTRFGVEEQGFVGIFQVAHAASVTIAFAIVVFFYHIQSPISISKKIFYFILIFFGLWLELQTFARTGSAMIFIASIYLFLIKKKLSFYIKLFPFVIIFGLGGWQYYESSEVVQMRLKGTNVYIEKSGGAQDIGSGRIKFYTAAIESWSNNGLASILIGLGEEKAKDMMQDKVGMRIYAHNGFIDILQFGGLLSTVLYLIFLYYLYIYIRKSYKDKFHHLVIALFLCYFIAMLTQGERFFLADVMFSISLALINRDEDIATQKI